MTINELIEVLQQQIKDAPSTADMPAFVALYSNTMKGGVEIKVAAPEYETVSIRDGFNGPTHF